MLVMPFPNMYTNVQDCRNVLMHAHSKNAFGLKLVLNLITLKSSFGMQGLPHLDNPVQLHVSGTGLYHIEVRTSVCLNIWTEKH